MKVLKNFNFKNKKVLIRCDFNVPLGDQGEILDDFRIKSTLPTIEYLMKESAKIILMSHLGRPEGKAVAELKLTPIQKLLEKYLNLPVRKSKDCIGKETEELVNEMKTGEVLLLENLRFHKEEEENDDNFTKDLVKLGDIYINDAFANCHRAHASMVGIPKYLPAAAGLLLEKEIKTLENFIRNPQKPLISIIGGKKVETKTKLIDAVSEISDWVLISGLIEKDLKEKNIKLKYPSKIISPIDSVNTFDIGPETIKIFQEKIIQAKTIFWNGPFGKIEEEKYRKGTKAIVETIIKSGAFSVVGGGETVEFINQMGLIDKFSHVSTGGGALLDFVCDGQLVAIEALK